MICTFYKKGCQETFESLQEVQDHIVSCSYAQKDCPLGCGQEVALKNIILHITQKCPNRNKNCYFCGLELNSIHLEVHLKSCIRKPVVCHFCDLQTLQKDLTLHMNSCPKRLLHCNMENFGCRFVGEALMMIKHEQDMNIHFPLVCNSMKMFSQSLEKISENKENIKADIEKLLDDKLKTIASNFSKEIDRLETNSANSSQASKENSDTFSNLHRKLMEDIKELVLKKKYDDLMLEKSLETILKEISSYFLNETLNTNIKLNEIKEFLSKFTDNSKNKIFIDKAVETTSPQLSLSLEDCIKLKDVVLELPLGRDIWFPKISVDIFHDYISNHFNKKSGKRASYVRLTQANFNECSKLKEEHKENIENIPYSISICGKYSNEEKLRIKFLFKLKDLNSDNPLAFCKHGLLALANTANEEVIVYCISLLVKFPDAMSCTFWLTKSSYDNYYLHFPESPFTYLYFV